jgi:uncharacterized protein YukE
MTDWQPLADEDPLPGDPDQVESLAGRLGTIGTDIAANTPTLRAVQSQDTWSGEAATEFTAKVGDLPDKLDKVGTRFATIAAALRDYTPVLREAQADARAALAVARQAQDAATRAQSALTAVVAQDGANAGRVDEAARYRGQISTATDDLTRAHRLLGEAVGKHRDAEKRAASRIAAASDDDLKNPHHKFLHKLKDGVHAVLKGVSNVAGWVAAGAGILALATCWIPGVDVVTAALALATGAAALLVDVALVPFGDKGWKELSLDALGVVPGGKIFEGAALAKNGVRVFEAAGGMGRIAGRGLKFTTGLRLESISTRLGAGLSHAGTALKRDFKHLGGELRVTGNMFLFPSLARRGFQRIDGPLGWLSSQLTTARNASQFGAVYRSAGLAYDATSAVLPLPWLTGSGSNAQK